MADSNPAPRRPPRDPAAPMLAPAYIAQSKPTLELQPRVLKAGETFAVHDHWGDMLAEDPSPKGLFQQDTRFLSRLELLLNGIRPLLLSSTVAPHGRALTVDCCNPDYLVGGRTVVKRDVLHVRRMITLEPGRRCERIAVRNFDLVGREAVLGLVFDTDFADIFEVRGTAVDERGELSADVSSADVAFRYRARDGLIMGTAVRFSRAPARLTRAIAEFPLCLAPGEEALIELDIALEAPTGLGPCGVAADETATRAPERPEPARIACSDERFAEALDRSVHDLGLLETETPHGPYPFAGIPWYSTVFGRDGIITALLAGWLDPSLSAGVLRLLAATQATTTDRARECEPGKIIHECRSGELARLGEIPFGHYYGTIDATPLFVMLAADTLRQTGDRALVDELWPHLEAAMAWIVEHGDRDGDGFVEYQGLGEGGLSNQAWKDSEDSVFHEDGTLASSPIRPVEVQAYVYAALRDMAWMAEATGRAALAPALREKAVRLREQVERAFWLEDLGTYALALDGDGRPCRVRSSNAGHLLFAGLPSRPRAERLAQTLLAPDSFSGWGIRTVAEGAARYNPMSYHNGSVWPHDNALIALGLARYGLKRPALAVLEGLADAAYGMDMRRLPEVFCGFVRTPGAQPTLYPVACSPQAWAAATIPGLVRAALGIEYQVERRVLLLDRPHLPRSVHDMQITNLQVGEARIDLSLTREDGNVMVRVDRRTEPLDVLVRH